VKNNKKGMTRESIKKSRLKKIKKKRFKIRYGMILLTLVLLGLLYLLGVYIYRIPIKNIIVKGNVILSDQEIIDAAGLKNYPSILQNSNGKIKRKLNKHTYIETVKVKKKKLGSKVIIEVDENRPLFYYQTSSKVVLEDGSMVKDKIVVPTVINQIPESVYNKFLKKMGEVPIDVLNKISEVQYKPTNVDTELFFLTMTDGNYVYITIYKFDLINNYNQYVEGFNNKKGILHLDSGVYLEVLEGA
jgi:cell division protein FtsQ